MSVFFYQLLVRFISTVHLCIIATNLIAVPLLILNEPFWVWMPMITFLVSPLVGGAYCMFNRVENHCRAKAGMPLIYDRLGELFEKRK